MKCHGMSVSKSDCSPEDPGSNPRLAKVCNAEIVETTFVVSFFSDIRRETTWFLVVPKRNNQE